MLNLLTVVLSLTSEEVEKCAREKCDSIKDSNANLNCRATCAQVPFGGKDTTDKAAKCQEKCGSDQTCYNNCIADFITQKGGKFVSSKNNGINDQLVVGNNDTSNSSDSSTNTTDDSTSSTKDKTVTGSASLGVVSVAVVGALSLLLQ
eukprot:NODE_849_length_3700_cov_0.478369.p2 type:complete len:148 gc:universal NODE_849_length_3700_cov_0.478369:3405-2962(-)